MNSSSPLTSRQQAVEFVHQLQELVNAHDIPGLVALYADDAVTVSPMFPQIAGRNAIAHSWDTIFSLFPDWRVNISDVLVDGDRLAFLGTASATDINGWFGQPPTGERIEYRAIIVLTIACGQIVHDERIYDLSGVLEHLEKSRLEKELRMAAELQRALLPAASYSNAYCEAAADSIPCRAIGGDFFEMLPLPSGNFGIALGDVAGKGPASALLASMIQGMLAVEMETESRPSQVLARLNRSLIRKRLEPSFATLVYGVLSPDGCFIYSSAGHNPPLMLTRNKVRRLATGGPILGAFNNSSFEEGMLALSEQDTIIMFSDGVTEARDGHDRDFGEERLISSVRGARACPAQETLGKIFTRFHEFCSGEPQGDDVSVFVLRYLG